MCSSLAEVEAPTDRSKGGPVVRKPSVTFVRWPSEAQLRSYCRSTGTPCLLVVEAGVPAPVCADANEDWIRVPVSREDVRSRVEALRQRTSGQSIPVVDPSGVLHFGDRWIALSGVQAHLMEHFVECYGEVVHRADLLRHLAELVSSPTRNSLDLHIMRTRRRLAPMGLRITTIRGCGYLLELDVDDRGEPANFSPGPAPPTIETGVGA